MDELSKQKLIAAIDEGDLSKVRDAIHCLQSIPTLEIVYELVDHCLCKKFKITKLLIHEVLRLKDGSVLGLEFLKKAIARGDAEAAKELINLGVDIRNQSYRFFHAACESKMLDVAELLLAKGLNDKNMGKDCEPMIHAAIRTGNVRLVELLIQHSRADVNSTFRGNSALHVAIKSYQSECVILLLNYGANANVYNSTGKTPLYKAVRKSTFKAIEHLIENGADVKSVNGPDQETPLHVACEKGFLKTANLLIDRGADINVSSKSFKNPLSNAIIEKREEIIQVLLDRGADISRLLSNMPPIHFVAWQGYLNITKRMLESGADVATKDKRGYKAIHLTASRGNYRIVKLLLDWGENVDSTTNVSATTPLQMAAANGHHEIVKLLVDRGASVNYQDNQKWAAIHYAAKKGCLKSVKYLLMNGSRVNFPISSEAKTSPLFFAAGGSHFEVFLAILDYDPEMSNNQYVLFDHYEYSHLITDNVGHLILYARENWQLFDKNLVKVIMKLQLQKKFIPPKYNAHIEESLELSKLRKKCEEELNRMKTSFIPGFKFSLFDFFTENHYKSVSLLSNDAVIEAFRKTNFTKKFPLYAELIMNHFENSLERRDFLDKGNKYLQTLFPQLVKVNLINKVFDYLADRDISRLITAFSAEC